MQDQVGNKWALISSKLPGRYSIKYAKDWQLRQKPFLLQTKEKPEEYK